MVLEFVEICVFVVVYSFRFCLSFFWAGGVFVEFSLNFFLGCLYVKRWRRELEIYVR